MLPSLGLIGVTALAFIGHVLCHSSDANFRNTAIVRTIDVGGATTHVTTSFQFNSLKDNRETYYFSLSQSDAEKTSWMEAKLKGHPEPLKIVTTKAGFSSPVQIYHVNLPKAMKADESATLVVSTVQSHASSPLPASVKQSEPQSLVYPFGVYVISPYETVLQRTKIRAPNPKILSWDEPEALVAYAGEGENPVSKSGATVTFGPFRAIPPSANVAFIKKEQQTIKFHYEYDAPVLTVSELKRSAEISHWGANLNIQDQVWLKNDGATLKGHFSRIEHAKQTHRPQTAMPYILRNIVLHLPSGVRDPYFYDIVGNVSTSNFRPAPVHKSNSQNSSPMDRNSILDLRPRYPLLGGWNYTFTIGYDMPLEDWVRYNSKDSSYVVGIPFLTPIPGALYDDVEFSVVLPEGANILQIITPFSIEAIERRTHVTFLDTAGRPEVVFRGKRMTDKHTGLVYITYTVGTSAHLRKPFAVGVAFFGMFCLGFVLRRLDISIRRSVHPKKQA